MDTAPLLVYIFSAIGLVDTSYLIYHMLNKSDVACWFFPPEWCHKVQHAPQSKTFGVPNPVLGFLMYVVLLVLTYLALQGTVSFWWVRGVITFGFLFSMYFTYVQAFVLKAFCTWCVVSALNFTVLFIASFYLM